MGQDPNETFGSTTTTAAVGAGRQHDETFGSATTLGYGECNDDNNNINNEGAGEGATKDKRRSTADAATAPGDGNDKSFAEQLVSLLEESMALLSDNDDGNDNNNDGAIGEEGIGGNGLGSWDRRSCGGQDNSWQPVG